MGTKIDLTGKTFGRLTVLGEGGHIGRALLWRCKCTCGNVKNVRGELLRNGVTRSCGCLEHENRMRNCTKRKALPEDYIGKTYGRITVESLFNRHEGTWVRGKCSCGNTWEGRLSTIVHGRIKSCGCLRDESTRDRRMTHGMTSGRSVTREYKAWAAMKRRCYDRNHKDYPYYGARGITVCESWRDDPAQFAEDMGKCPEGWTLDRIDNNGHYSPENCRWASRLTQSRNSRRTRMVEYGGETKPLTQWVEELGLNLPCVRSRLYLQGMSIEEAFETPVRGDELFGSRRISASGLRRNADGSIRVKRRRSEKA